MLSAIAPFLLETRYQPRVWGGRRLGAGPEPVGEAWGAFDGNRISSGPQQGLTLAEACEQHAEAILGASVVERHGPRFPILTKLLDTREWLSVQLHPNDEQAEALEGPGQRGKTEAWHLIETGKRAEIILGLNEGVDIEGFASAIRGGKTLSVISRQAAQEGDTWFIPAGTVHALGPNIFLYEVQQSSDITYRVYDWDRPASAGRELHIEQAIQCIQVSGGERFGMPAVQPGTPRALVSCPYFTLQRLDAPPGTNTRLDTGDSFLALTAIDGSVVLATGHGDLELQEFATAIVPAGARAVAIQGNPGGTLMIASA